MLTSINWCSFLFAAPLAFGAVQPWAWGALGIPAAILLVLWASGSALGKKIRVHLSLIYLPAAAFLLLAVIQYFGGLTLDHAATKEALGKLITDLILFFLAGQFLAEASEAQWRKVGGAVTLYAFALGVFASLQFFSSHNLIYWVVPSPGYTFGPYVNHNHYAGLMEMLIPIAAAYLLSRPREDPQRLILGLSLCVPVASVLLSGSRGGFVSLLVEALIFGWVLWRCHSGAGIRYLEAMLALGITVGALLFFWLAPNKVVSRLAGLADLSRTTEITFRQRAVVAADTLRIFRDHPWVGIGLGSFGTVFPQYRTFPTNLGWAHAHNDYAEALAETGLAGAIPIVFALIFFFKRAFRDLYFRLRDEAGWIQFGTALGCCGLLVHSFADFNLHIPANAAWFATCAALASAEPFLPEAPFER